MTLNEHRNKVVRYISSKLILIAAEKKLYEIAIDLLDDNIYKREDAAEDLLEVISLLGWEKESIKNSLAKLIDLKD